MKRENKSKENYLERRPMRPEEISWSVDENGMVILDIENKGMFNKLAQILFHRPKISHIHLDEMGSFIWPLLDGEKDIVVLGVLVKEHFGDKAEPLYERLAKYFQILDSYSFLRWKE